MSESEVKKNEKQYMDEAKDVGSVSRILSQVETVGLTGLGGADEMRKKLEEHSQIRDVILEYIDKSFVKGIDYGWTDPRSTDKNTLKKPGAEKICRMFNTSPRWIRDNDTWEMLGKPTGCIFYICQITDNKTGKVIGEGRGAATLNDKARDANKTVKNAEKCALVDAAIYTFMLSEFFTQDDNGRTQTLAQLKAQLITDVDLLRTGVKSDISGNRWIHMAIKDVLKKSLIATEGEMVAIRKAVFEDKVFNLATGERKPAGRSMEEMV